MADINVTLNFSASSSVPGVTNVFSIAASGTATVDIDLTDVTRNLTGLISFTYNNTASTTGMECAVYQGFGPGLPVNRFQPIPCTLTNGTPSNPRSNGAIFSTSGLETDNTGDPISLDTVTPSQSSAQTFHCPFAVTLPLNSKYISLVLTNNDVSNTATGIQIRLNV